jgi:agmatinase
MALEDAANEVDRAFTGAPKGRGFENTFSGANSFLRRRYTKDLSGYDLAITGIPFDQAVTNRPGTRLGPRALREASAMQVPDRPMGWGGYDPLEVLAIADAGDMAFDYAQVAAVPGLIEAHVAGILAQGAGCITLGGDHSISLPILRAHAAVHGPLALVQFDAHSDTWADDNPARIDHGTMFYKGVKEGVIDASRSAQIGIRTDNPDPLGILTITAREVHESTPAQVAARVKAHVGAGPAYVSFDIDALDPAFAPGTGTPVWGGLHSWQAAAILRDLDGLPMVGGDIVEVSPPFDTTGATAIAGAHVAMELICLWGRHNR